MNKRTAVVTFQKYVLNPLSKLVAGGKAGPALLETTGRTSGAKRRVPVGATFRDGSYWIVAEQGRHANYVRNIESDPRVRIKYRGRWHEGIANILPDEDPREHTHGVNGLFVRLVGTELLTIRVDV